jgi:hypothetical protein
LPYLSRGKPRGIKPDFANKLYPLYEVIGITIPAIIAMARGWEDIERYTKAKKARLSRFLKPGHGIPYPPAPWLLRTPPIPCASVSRFHASLPVRKGR